MMHGDKDNFYAGTPRNILVMLVTDDISWLSKKWLAPLFRGFHSSLAPTARPGSYAGKPLLRKAFCGFAVHPPGGLLLSLRDNSPCVAKSDESIRGGKAERRQWREERGGSPVSKGAPGRPHGPTQRDLCELHCGPRAPRGFSTSWGPGGKFAAGPFALLCVALSAPFGRGARKGPA